MTHHTTLCAVSCCVVLCWQVFVAQGRRRRAESTILESESLIKALQQQSELDNKSLAAIIQVSPGEGWGGWGGGWGGRADAARAGGEGVRVVIVAPETDLLDVECSRH
jgi:hypothetical protein